MKKSLKVNSCQVCALINRTAQVFIKIRFSLSLKKDGREGNWASFHLHFPTSDILISTPRKMFCCSCIPPPTPFRKPKASVSPWGQTVWTAARGSASALSPHETLLGPWDNWVSFVRIGLSAPWRTHPQQCCPWLPSSQEDSSQWVYSCTRLCHT